MTKGPVLAIESNVWANLVRPTIRNWRSIPITIRSAFTRVGNEGR
ncbi:hypothetical protein [Flavobacterium cerinum]|nr:hypothetical protein [Flavobacterium cerinum]